MVRLSSNPTQQVRGARGSQDLRRAGGARLGYRYVTAAVRGGPRAAGRSQACALHPTEPCRSVFSLPAHTPAHGPLTPFLGKNWAPELLASAWPTGHSLWRSKESSWGPQACVSARNTPALGLVPAWVQARTLQQMARDPPTPR